MLMAGCGTDRPEPFELVEREDGSYDLIVQCFADATARIREAATEVRIDDLRGTSLEPDDCQGIVHVQLADELGDRSVVVNGEIWRRVDDGCSLARFASPNATGLPAVCP